MNKLIAAAALGAMAVPMPALAQAATDRGQGSKPGIRVAMDAAIDSAIREHRIVGTVVIVARNGHVIYRRAAGFADREALEPMREDTVFRLASVSKPYVTAAAMKLVERGEIGLDDPVTKYLPYFTPELADGTRPVITVRQLLTHTSGLGYAFEEPGDGPYHRLGVSDGLDLVPGSLEDNLSRLAKATLLFRPGTAWRYSLGIDVVGAVLEKVTGKPLADVVRREVTHPLGIEDTGFIAGRRDRVATAYANVGPAPVRMTDGIKVPMDDGAITFAPSRAFDPAAYSSGGAGMVGTADDLLRLLETIRSGGGPILKPSTVTAMRRDQVGAQAKTQGPGWGFGYGWAVLDDPTIAHTPQARGTIQWGGVYGHSWFVDGANGLSVVALTNTAFEGMSGRFVIDVRDATYAATGASDAK